MAKVAIAKKDSDGTPIHGAQQFSAGEQFKILEEPVDFMTFIIFGQLEAAGDLEQATVIDFGEGFMVFFEEENEKAWGVHDYFEIKEVA